MYAAPRPIARPAQRRPRTLQLRTLVIYGVAHGHLMLTELRLEHGCLLCTMRLDLLPLLRSLDGPVVVVHLDPCPPWRRGRTQVATGRSAMRHSSMPSARRRASRPCAVSKRTASWASTQ